MALAFAACNVEGVSSGDTAGSQADGGDSSAGGATNSGGGQVGGSDGGSSSGGNGGAGNSGAGNSGGGNSGGMATGGAGVGGKPIGGAGGGATIPCNPPCGLGFTCCSGKCVNTANDINNCGACGKACAGNPPFCNGTICEPPPCKGTACITTKFCCGTFCCSPAELCCVVQQGGPVSPPACFTPVNGTCPVGTPGAICAAPDTPIATPDGERPIASLQVGDLVYSVDGDAISVVPIRHASRTLVSQHQVIRVGLSDGGVLHISAGHPTADGRIFGDLDHGDRLDAATITSVERVPYSHEYTYDILPDSDTGHYFAAGERIGSTLR